MELLRGLLSAWLLDGVLVGWGCIWVAYGVLDVYYGLGHGPWGKGDGADNARFVARWRVFPDVLGVLSYAWHI